MSLEIRIDRTFSAVSNAVDKGRIPGAVLGVVNRLGQRATRIAGQAQSVPYSRSMEVDTWFDLASLTKVVFTAPRILALHESGVIDLEAPLISVLPDLNQYHSGSWIRNVTFAQCLAHETGFPAVEPIYTYGRDPALLRAFVLQRDWKRGPAVYSDINFILLGLVLERIHGCRLRELSPGAGLAFEADPENCAATELCTWRERVMCGEVHDDNCYALEGAGHAGLFGTVNAVLDHAQSLLDGIGTGSGMVPDSGTSTFCIEKMRQRVNATRTYGWEGKHKNWSGGELCSEGTIGHTGFTGTGLWIDFDNGLAWTLLTNRIHPTRHSDSGIVALRKTVSEGFYLS